MKLKVLSSGYHNRHDFRIPWQVTK